MQELKEIKAASFDTRMKLFFFTNAEKMQLFSHSGVDKTDGITSILAGQFGPIEKALKSQEILSYTQLDGWEWFNQSTPLGNFRPGSIFLIPLMAKQQSIGIVILACGIQTISPQQKKALETLLSFAAPNLITPFSIRRSPSSLPLITSPIFSTGVLGCAASKRNTPAPRATACPSARL